MRAGLDLTTVAAGEEFDDEGKLDFSGKGGCGG